MGAESIPAPVDSGDVRRDHLVLRASERSVGEMHARGGLDGVQKIRAQAHSLEDFGHHTRRLTTIVVVALAAEPPASLRWMTTLYVPLRR